MQRAIFEAPALPPAALNTEQKNSESKPKIMNLSQGVARRSATLRFGGIPLNAAEKACFFSQPRRPPGTGRDPAQNSTLAHRRRARMAGPFAASTRPLRSFTSVTRAQIQSQSRRFFRFRGATVPPMCHLFGFSRRLARWRRLRRSQHDRPCYDPPDPPRSCPGSPGAPSVSIRSRPPRENSSSAPILKGARKSNIDRPTTGTGCTPPAAPAVPHV
jgi:hypothetical protein